MIAYHIANAEPVQRQRDYQAEGEEWFMPNNATDIEPPDFNKETHTCSFNGTEWVVAEIVPDTSPTSPLEPQPDPSLTEFTLMNFCILLLCSREFINIIPRKHRNQTRMKIY